MLTTSLKSFATINKHHLANAVRAVTVGKPLLPNMARTFTTSYPHLDKLRVGFVPEHFALPLHIAHEKYGLRDHANIQAYPAGTGTMIEAFRAGELDVAIGLTEAFIVGKSKDENGTAEKTYHMVGAYTTTPLTWAISTGGLRSDIQCVDELSGLKAGISRKGSGSHIMASVLAQQRNWLRASGEAPFDFVVCGPYDNLRDAVNNGAADFFMWEVFTSNRYYVNGTLKYVGEIATPWNAWHIAAAGETADERVANYLLPALEKGIKWFEERKEEAVEYISMHMAYSAEDAAKWYHTVNFASPKELGSLDPEGIGNAVKILKTAGVMGARDIKSFEDLAASNADIYANR